MTIDELQGAAGSVLQVEFIQRDNTDLGLYYKATVGDEVFDIYRNYDESRPEDEVLRSEFADYPVLLFVSRTDRPDEIRDLLFDISGLDHLKREML
ncbi:MAG TPA: hypothetical protein VG076_16480 [Acidimicrobiales bacterium]|jgi:hypothetical protein|nr:hypothetical protein [Acidimicrobiales bacterium]